MEGAVAKAHSLFDLKSTNSGSIPLSRYVKLEMELLGLKVPRVRFLITQNPNEALDPEHKTKLLSIMGWNVARLLNAYYFFHKKHLKLRKIGTRWNSNQCLSQAGQVPQPSRPPGPLFQVTALAIKELISQSALTIHSDHICLLFEETPPCDAIGSLKIFLLLNVYYFYYKKS